VYFYLSSKPGRPPKRCATFGQGGIGGHGTPISEFAMKKAKLG